MQEPVNSIGEAVDAAFNAAVTEWRREHAPNVGIGDLLPNHLRRVTVKSDVIPGGILDVTVTVQGRKAYQRELYFWKAHRLHGEWRFL